MLAQKNIKLIFFFSLVALTAILCFMVLKPFLATIAVALIFSVVLSPLHERLTRLFQGKSGLAAFILTLLVVLVAVSALSFLAANIYQESRNFYVKVQNGETQTLNAIAEAVGGKVQALAPNVELSVQEVTDKIFAWTAAHVAPVASSTANIFFNILIVTISMFFILKDGKSWRSTFLSWSPLDDIHDNEILSRLEVTINSVIRGSLLIAAIQGTLVGVGFFIFGVPEAFLWGTVAAITALIPGVGTSLVLIPGILYLFLTGHNPGAVGLLIWSALIVGMIDNFLAPYLYGKGSKVHPLFMLLSVLGGVSAFGIAGFIFGPVLLSLAMTLIDVYKLIIKKTE